jgi:hypothetical protein
VGIEHTGNTTGNYTTDRNIDAKYTHMIWRVQGGTFQDWTNGPNYVDPSYTVDHVALGAVNTFLAPLD